MRTIKALGAAALAAGAILGPAHAQSAGDSASADIIVTGTRSRDVTARESAAPIAVVSGDDLRNVGETDLLRALAQVTPSFTSPGMTGGDLSNLVHTARLRGLSPNHTLILVNGRRRHLSSVVNATPGPVQGSSPADLDFIPLSAIERVEVLQDGAAAQYGSDAIAGVINIILKDNAEGGSAYSTLGSTYEGDGETYGVGGQAGYHLGDRGFLNISGDIRRHEATDRTGDDLRPQAPSRDIGRIAGDPDSRLGALSYNGGIHLSDAAELYSFGTYGRRKSFGYQNYRLASDIPTPYTGTIYPQGYIPRETIDETDYSATLGARGDDLFGWHWDVATTYGADHADIGVTNSINIDLLSATGASPSNFDAGAFEASQWSTNVDLSHDFDIGLARPLTVALGLEHRRETYEIEAGDGASRYAGGSIGFPGYSLTDAGDHARENTSAYLDLATHLTEAWSVELAGRYEHYSDFGDTNVGKISTRYDFNPRFALRGTASTGFQAPTLQQQYFSTTNVGLDSALVQLPANSAAAALIGAKPLKPEESVNLSAGFVAELLDGLLLTLDAYQVDIDNRIVNTGFLVGTFGGSVFDPAVNAAIIANGNGLGSASTVAASYFTNGIDTRTRGVEFTARYTSDFEAAGSIDWSLDVNVNTTKIRRLAALPSSLIPFASFYNGSSYDPPAINALIGNSPRSKVIFGADYHNGPFDVDLHLTRYGAWDYVSSSSYVFPPFYDDHTGPKIITDLAVSYEARPGLKFTLGANNLFDVYPHETDPASRDRNTTIYPIISPFGFNGGYYYARIGYSF